MRVYALVGPSGTGKSYRAMEVASNYNIEIMIDDGLIIRGSKVLAGSSAKKESTRIAAIKRALFTEESHVGDAQRAIGEARPQSILILGTSRGMVERIQRALGLPEIERFFSIQEVSNREDIQRALQERKGKGKHVIPVPAMEVKKYFSGYFLDPLRIFRKSPTSKKTEIQEKTVVRPTFSYLGRYTIADTVVKSVVHHIASGVEGIYRVGRIHIISNEDGLTINLDLYVVYGVVIPKVLERVQSQITKGLEHMTGQNILGVNIYVKGLWVQGNGN